VRVREFSSLKSQSVDIRRLDLRRPVTPDIAVSQIISEDDDNVGLWFGCRMQRGEGGKYK
jgi:hypothetical protein